LVVFSRKELVLVFSKELVVGVKVYGRSMSFVLSEMEEEEEEPYFSVKMLYDALYLLVYP